MSVYDVKTFNGGSNNFVDPGLLNKNQGQRVENANISNGNLTSVPGLSVVPIKTSPDDMGHFGTANNSVVSYLGKSYWSINDAVAEPYYKGNLYSLGVPYPIAPTLTSISGTLTGTFGLCHTYISDDGYESAPGIDNTWHSTITITDGKIQVTLPTTAPAGVAKIRTYRTIDKGSDYYLWNESSLFGMTIEDQTSDFDIMTGDLMDTLNFLPPPDGGKFLTEANGTFFVAVDDKVYYSEQGNPHAWPPLNWINMPATVTGMVEEFEGILAFTDNHTICITGYDVLTVAKRTLPGEQGCKNWRTISTITDAPIWESNDGLCLWDGSVITLVTHNKYEIDFESTHSVVANDVYYLFHNSGALRFDRRSGDVFSELGSFVVNNYAWYDANVDQLYLFDGVDEIYEYGTGTMEVLAYRSPHFNGWTAEKGYEDGGLAEKNFRRIWLRNDSPVSVTLYVEGVEIFNGTMNAGDKFIYFPAGSEGRYASVKLETTGIVFDYMIEYEVKI